MVERKPIESEISFSDGEIIAYEKKNDDFVIFVRAWNCNTIKILCENMIGFMDKGAWNISDFCEAGQDTELLTEVIKRQFESLPDVHDYTSFQFMDNDGAPVRLSPESIIPYFEAVS